MDSFFLAEMFKYLFLLFAEEEDLPFNVEDYIFTTEAHLLPLSLSTASNSQAPPVVNNMVLHISTITVLLASLCCHNTGQIHLTHSALLSSHIPNCT